MNSKTYQILIVDDLPENLDALTGFIEGTGEPYEILQANNGRLAYEIAAAEKPDIVITDWEMPEMDGIDLIRRLKANETTADIPVIMCTGVMTSSANLQTALDAGAVDYIRKPVDPIELTARLRSMLSLAASHRQIKAQHLELTQKYKELAALSKISFGLISIFDLESLLQLVIEAASQAIPAAEKGSILLIDPNGQVLTIKANVGYDADFAESFRLNIREGFSGQAFAEKRSALIAEVKSKYVPGIKSAIVAILEVKGQIIGTISLENFSRASAFTPADLRLLETFAAQAACAIDSAMAYRALEQKSMELAMTLTELQATQQQLILAEKMAALGKLIANIAHEVNSPLGAIRASTDNIQSALQATLRGFPVLWRRLLSQQQDDFQALLERALAARQSATSREERQLRQTLARHLNEQGVADAAILADWLVEMGIWNDVEPFLPLLKAENAKDITEMAYNLVSQQRNADNIKMAVDRAAKVVFALKTYTQHDVSGRMRQASVSSTIEAVLTLYDSKLKQGVEVSKQYEDTSPILCYADQLSQVWTHLIHNAIQAMDNKGRLDIRVATDHGELPGDSIMVAITDSGGGIPDEVKPRIFEPFFTTRPTGEGSGLGLEIVRRIVEAHRGKIAFDSTPGRTTFRVWLPVSG